MRMIVLTLVICAWAGLPACGAEAGAAVNEPPLVVTSFFYWYRHDTKGHFVDGDGSDALTDHLPDPAKVSYASADPEGSIFEGAFKPGPALGPLAANAWHTVRFELADARFANRADGGDFRLSAGGTDIAVAEIAVEKR